MDRPFSPRRLPRLAAEAAGWAAVAFGFWVVTLSTVPAAELVVAGICALLCGVAAVAARWAIEESWSFDPKWLGPLWRLPAALFTDAGQVLAAPWRQLLPRHRTPGDFEVVPTGAGGDSARARGRRALAVLAVSVTPGTYAVDIDGRSGDLLVHRLARRGPSSEQAVKVQAP